MVEQFKVETMEITEKHLGRGRMLTNEGGNCRFASYINVFPRFTVTEAMLLFFLPGVCASSRR